MLTADGLTALIRGALPDAEIHVVDLKGTGDHFEARVVAAAFEGLSMVQQHQAVYAPLRALLATGELHALALKTYSPAAWAKAQANAQGAPK